MVTKHRAVKKTPSRKQGAKRAAKPRPLWEEIVSIGERIPSDELAGHPVDFVQNYHHYRHGHAKRARR
jgi:hypothetical protein